MRRRNGQRSQLAGLVVTRAILGTFLLGAFAVPARATDCLAPNGEVTSGVTLRAQPSTQSSKRGLLATGQSLPLVATVPNWYEVTTTGGV